MTNALFDPQSERDFLTRSGLAPEQLTGEFAQLKHPAAHCRDFLNKAKQALDSMYIEGIDVRDLVGLKSHIMDQLLGALWQHYEVPDNCSLLAVGGYGRGELHPHSDIDLLLLAEDDIDEKLGEKLSSFITLLWDLKLDIGHSVRTLEECIESAREDVTIGTNLLETRTIAGPERLRDRLTQRVYSDEVYTSKEYFLAKRQEQDERHEKYSGTEYNLEPNLKSSPGTLRDIQTIAWITKRHFGPDAIDPRARYDFLTDEEFAMLLDGETFLWTMRYGLQMIADRNENRLLFDHQRKLAKILGYEDCDGKLGVEHMMQKYYRTVLGLAEL
ncbi:MAG: nucleotidyltransferase domain-containing protein, partial [Oleiphilaceae bacterium]|nr:nucleotidyltransferase domain-containing protein [Oleiphilaceae bacterium]